MWWIPLHSLRAVCLTCVRSLDSSMCYVTSSRPTHKPARVLEPKLIRGGLQTSAVSLQDLNRTIYDMTSFFQKGQWSSVLVVVAQDFLSADIKFLRQTLGILIVMNSMFQGKLQHPPPSYTGLSEYFDIQNIIIVIVMVLMWT